MILIGSQTLWLPVKRKSHADVDAPKCSDFCEIRIDAKMMVIFSEQLLELQSGVPEWACPWKAWVGKVKKRVVGELTGGPAEFASAQGGDHDKLLDAGGGSHIDQASCGIPINPLWGSHIEWLSLCSSYRRNHLSHVSTVMKEHSDIAAT